jgi:hypothetical protein
MSKPELLSQQIQQMHPSFGVDAHSLPQQQLMESFPLSHAHAGGGLSEPIASDNLVPLQVGGEQQQEVREVSPRFKPSETVIYSITLADGTSRTRIPRLHIAAE